MKNLIKINEFVSSSHDSSTEKEFLQNAIPQVMDKHLTRTYAQKLEENYGIIRPDTKKSSSRSKWIFITLAILALSVSAFIYFQPENNSNEIKQQYAAIDIQYEELDLSQRGEIKDEILISEITKAYLNKDTKTVVDNFNKLSEPSVLNNKTLYLIGLSFALENDYVQAENTLNLILNREETIFSHHQEARWLLAKVLLKNDNKDAALKVLKEIKSNDYKYNEAQKLINK